MGRDSEREWTIQNHQYQFEYFFSAKKEFYVQIMTHFTISANVAANKSAEIARFRQPVSKYLSRLFLKLV